MSRHEEKIKLMRKYASEIQTNFTFYIQGDIPSKKINNAVKKFAQGLDTSTVIGFYDTTISKSGKEGYIFTDSKVYYLEMLEKPKKLWYDDIKSVEIGDAYRYKDCDKILIFHLYDGSIVKWTSSFLNKTPLYHFFQEMLKIINQFKFHSRQGHGFAAERANNLFDQLTGHDAQIVGDNNAKNGADRILDGIEIQSKYCATGSRCVNECFENDGKGAFRYYSKNGMPMQIEVPSDKYEAAVSAMEEKIKRGQVDGVSNPEDAKKIVKKGHYTYAQAKNIAKAGTVESITYDAVNGAIIAASALGVTTILTFATSVWNGEDFGVSLKNATCAGLKVGGTAFITSVLASQLSKAGLNSALVSSSEVIVGLMGPKASAILVNAFRNGSNIYGAAAMKSAAKLLRGNVITSGVTVVVLSSFDIANIFRGRISGKQLFKNLVNTTSTVAGGTAGWIGGAAIGSALFPGVGTVIGGLIGSIGAGTVASRATDTVVGAFVEDDANEMVKIIEKVFSELATDYLLSQKEAEKIVDCLQTKLDGKMLKEMFASSDRKEFARNLLTPLVEKEISMRKRIIMPTMEQFSNSLKEVIEEAADSATV